MSKRLLVLGVGGPFREDFFRTAARRGVQTILVDDNPYSRYDRLTDVSVVRAPNDPGLLDDLPATVGPVDGVTSLSDLAAGLVDRVAREYGLPGPGTDVARAAYDKATLRRLTNDVLPPVPWRLVETPDDLDAFCRTVSGPVVLKPVDGAGSFGVTVARDAAQARSRLGYVTARSRRGTAIVEAYVPGDEYSFEVCVDDGRLHSWSMTEKVTTGAPAFLERQHLVSRHPALDVSTFLATLVAALGVEFAVLHVEARRGAGGWHLIEAAARPAGGMITEITRTATGIDLYDVQISLALGERPAEPGLPDAVVAGVRFVIGTGTVRDAGSLSRVCAGLPSVAQLSPLLPIGTRLADLDANWCRAGYVLAHGAAREPVLNDLREAEQRLTRALGLADAYPDGGGDG